MEDQDTLKILFYLREFNPKVTINDLNSALNIDVEEIKQKLDILESLKIVNHSEPNFELSVEGRIWVSGIYNDLGETPPE